MENKNLDEMIKTSLIQGTRESIALKDQVWHDIEQSLKNKDKKAVIKLPAKINRKPLFAYTAAAAVLLLTFLTFTSPGQAAVKRIKQVLLPEKQIVERLEGTEEKTKVSLQESNLGYTIYFDKEWYHLEKVNGKDRIVPNLKPGENLPEVYMEIEHVLNKNPDKLAEEIEAELRTKFPEVTASEKVTEPVQGLLIKAKSGLNWNDIVVRYYLVSNGQGGTFIMKQHYFTEASEGHGARFYHILKEFRLVTP